MKPAQIATASYSSVYWWQQEKWCLSQVILWRRVVFTTFQQCRGLIVVLHSVWGLVLSIFMLRENSLVTGLASFWIYPNPFARTDAAVTKAPTVTPLSRIIIKTMCKPQNGSAAQSTLDNFFFFRDALYYSSTTSYQMHEFRNWDAAKIN